MKQFKFTVFTASGEVMDWKVIEAESRKQAHENAKQHLLVQGWFRKPKYNLRKYVAN